MKNNISLDKTLHETTKSSVNLHYIITEERHTYISFRCFIVAVRLYAMRVQPNSWSSKPYCK